ncbi:hypothetical protein ABID25_005932 [Mesorhizobium abyssinicae]
MAAAKLHPTVRTCWALVAVPDQLIGREPEKYSELIGKITGV